MASYARGGPHSPASPPPPVTPSESARYTGEMLESLKKIALGNAQNRLAHLLSLAAVEARYLADQAQET